MRKPDDVLADFMMKELTPIPYQDDPLRRPIERIGRSDCEAICMRAVQKLEAEGYIIQAKPIPKKDMCCRCHKVAVDTAAGYDTCPNCCRV
jgi:hypothetical protein